MQYLYIQSHWVSHYFSMAEPNLEPFSGTTIPCDMHFLTLTLTLFVQKSVLLPLNSLISFDIQHTRIYLRHLTSSEANRPWFKLCRGKVLQGWYAVAKFRSSERLLEGWFDSLFHIFVESCSISIKISAYIQSIKCLSLYSTLKYKIYSVYNA